MLAVLAEVSVPTSPVCARHTRSPHSPLCCSPPPKHSKLRRAQPEQGQTQKIALLTWWLPSVRWEGNPAVYRVQPLRVMSAKEQRGAVEKQGGAGQG